MDYAPLKKSLCACMPTGAAESPPRHPDVRRIAAEGCVDWKELSAAPRPWDWPSSVSIRPISRKCVACQPLFVWCLLCRRMPHSAAMVAVVLKQHVQKLLRRAGLPSRCPKRVPRWCVPAVTSLVLGATACAENSANPGASCCDANWGPGYHFLFSGLACLGKFKALGCHCGCRAFAQYQGPARAAAHLLQNLESAHYVPTPPRHPSHWR